MTLVRTLFNRAALDARHARLLNIHQDEHGVSRARGIAACGQAGRADRRAQGSGDAMNEARLICRLMAGAALGALCAPAYAQPEAEAPDASTDVIVVTATRAETPVERLPVQIDVIDRDEIELNAISTLADALQFSPGVNAVQSGPAGSITSVFTRGSNSKHTLALFDGIRLNDASAPNGQFNFGQDLLGDAARVEVVRGPLSSVYGSDAIGGVVNIVPRMGADSAFEPYFEIAAGEFSTLRGLAGAAGTIDRFSYNLTVEAFETDGFDEVPDRFAENVDDPDGAQFVSVTALGGYALGAGVTLEALYRARRAESEFDTFSGGPSFSQRADDPDLEVSQDDYDVWRLGANWVSEARNLDSRLRGGQVLNERESSNDGAVTDTAEGTRTFVEWLNVWRPQDRGAARDVIVSYGVQYQNEAIDTAAAFANPLSVEEYSVGAYALVTAGFGERVDISVSGRFDEYEEFGGETTWNAGAVIDIPEIGAQLVGSYGTSFKAPTLSERFSNSAFTTANPDLDPEEGASWEVGLRGGVTLFGEEDWLRYGATYFDSEIDNLIEFVFDLATFTGSNQNVGLAEIDGYEVFLEANPSEKLTARVDYTNTDAFNANTGQRLLRRPENAWSASVSYRPIERAGISLRYLFNGERTDVNYNDAGFFQGSGGFIGSYQLVNLSGTLDLTGNLQLFGSVNNLLNEDYEQPEAFQGAPRSVTLGLRGRF